ncbi:MAG: TolC family protein [Verrucomicrobia bacterium]|nr:TolC family protein [Verrucomicrobiota bacterium]MBI3868601.1 TolC family protein [Verrucomicrobiota bacterium]
MTALAFLVSSSALPAADPAPQNASPLTPGSSLSLAEAKKLAFTRNWDLLAARSDVDIAAAQKIVAREFPNPTVSLSTTKINTDGSPASTRLGNSLWHRSYDTIAAVGQLFEIGGKRSNRKAAAVAGIRGAEARFADARRLLDLAVTKAYVAALQSTANVMILHESAASLRKEAQIAETRLKAGDISKSDRAQIEVTAERFELDAQAAEAAARNAKVELEILLGEKSPQGLWTAADSQEGILKTASVDGLTEIATARPDLLAARADLEKADAQLRLQKSLRIPDPTVTVQYEREPPDQANTVGFGVSFPLPLWNLNRGNISAARAAREQAALQADKVNAQIASDILESRVAYLAAIAKQERYAKEIQPKSAEIKKTVSFAYQRGGASLLDLLSAERNDNDIRLASVQATSEAIVAGAGLRSALNLPSTRSP